MNKKIAMSTLSIFAALTIMGGATYAAFTSTDTNDGNTFASGELTLDVQVGGNSVTPAFAVTNAAPGQSFTQVINLINTGTLGSTSTVLQDIVFTIPSATVPDLADKLDLEIWDDVNGDGLLDGGDLLKGSAPLNSPAWSNIDLGFGINPSGGNHQVIARITMNAGADNTYQGTDAGTFQFMFTTSQ